MVDPMGGMVTLLRDHVQTIRVDDPLGMVSPVF